MRDDMWFWTWTMVWFWGALWLFTQVEGWQGIGTFALIWLGCLGAGYMAGKERR